MAFPGALAESVACSAKGSRTACTRGNTANRRAEYRELRLFGSQSRLAPSRCTKASFLLHGPLPRKALFIEWIEDFRTHYKRPTEQNSQPRCVVRASCCPYSGQVCAQNC